jgi:hypothetical protein
MTTSQPENTKVMDAQAVTGNPGETVALPSEVAPAGANAGEASTSSEPARQEQSAAEAAQESIAAAGPSSAVEHDPAPIQPPIQPVSVSDAITSNVSIVYLHHLVILASQRDNVHDHPLLKLPQESDFDSSDSAYGDSDHLSDTTSIPSTIWKHRYENGRRYHKFREGEYWGPNDEVQNDQLDIAHHMFLMLLDNKLHLAPIQSPQRILDLGCGTGIWCMDMADGILNPLPQLPRPASDTLPRTPWRRNHRRRPLPHPTLLHAAKLQIRNRRRNIALDLPLQLRLHQHPLAVRFHR